MDSFFCSLSPKILVNQMSIWPKGNEMLGTGFGKRIPLAYQRQFLFLQGPGVGSDNGSWLCVSEQKRMVRLALVNSELQTRDLFCIWAENLGFWMSKVVKDNPLINFCQLTCTSSLVFQITVYFHPFSHILQHCKSILELRPLRWAGTVMPKQ